MVGFNRRFAPLARWLKERLDEGPMAIVYRVNAGAIPADSWIQDPEVGGGRIVGEVCHFVDFLTYLCGALPVSVHATALPDPQGLNDTVTINVRFANGSIGTVAYFTNGNRRVEKEYVEVYQCGQTAVLRDFKKVELYGGRRRLKKRLLCQDKGQAEMVRQFLQAVKDGGPTPIPIEEQLAVTRACFAALESLRTGQTVRVQG